MDMLLSDLDAVAYDVFTSRSMYPFAVYQSGYTAMIATERLVSHKNANSYLQDIILYYNEDTARQYNVTERYFTTMGPFDSETFWRYIHPFVWEHEPLRELMDAMTGPRLLYPVYERARTGEKAYLLYIHPDSATLGSATTRGIILFMIDPAMLERNLAQTALLHGGTLQICNVDGSIVYAAGEPLSDAWQAWQSAESREPVQVWPRAQAQAASNHVTMERLPSGEALLKLRTVPRGLTYMLYLPDGVLPSYLPNPFLSFFPFILALIGIGLASAYALIRSLLKPISQITDILVPDAPPSRALLRNMVFSVRELQSRRDYLEYCVQRQGELSRMQCVHNLLQGSYESEAEIRQRFGESGMDCDADLYLVLIASVMGSENLRDDMLDLRSAAIEVLSHVECAAGELRWVVPMDNEQEFAVLCGLSDLPEEMLWAHVQSLFDSAYAMLSTGYGAALTMGAGLTTPLLCRAADSLRQAQRALNGRFLLGTHCLLRYTAALYEHGADPVWYPVTEEAMILQALSVSDYQRAASITGQMLEDMRAKMLPVHVAKSICLSITHRLIQFISENTYGNELVQMFWRVIRLVGQPNATLDAFEDALLAGYARICGDHEGGVQEPMRAELLCRRVEAYIREHYADQDLSLQRIAEALSLSEGHLVRTYKKQTGTTIIQSVDSVRMTHAQGLLRETNLSLDEIIRRCGHLDKSNFIRKFKKRYHLTPMQYRGMMQAESWSGEA